MNNNFAKAFGIGLAAVAVIVCIILFMQQGAQVNVQCQAKTRTLATSDIESLVIADLHLTNPSSYPFIIRDVTVTLESDKGNVTRGVASRSDAERYFAATPQSGPYHPAFFTKAPVPAKGSIDYTVLSGFSMPEQMLKDGKRFRITILELDGKSFDCNW